MRIIFAIVFLIGIGIGNGEVLESPLSKPDFKKAVRAYNAGKFETAERIATRITTEPFTKYTSASYLLAVRSRVALEKFDEAIQMGQDFLEKYPATNYRNYIYFTFGDMYVAQGNYAGAFRMYFKSKNETNSKIFNNKIDTRLINTIQYTIPIETTNELLLTNFKVKQTGILNLAKAYSLINKGLISEAISALEKINKIRLPEPYLDLYRQLNKLVKSDKSRKISFGVIVPLSGEDADVGKSFIDGIKKAMDNLPKYSKNISLVVHDNRSETVQTLLITEKLKKNPNILGVIGPLDPERVLATAGALKSTNLSNLIPMSAQNDISKISDYLFQLKSDWDYRGRMSARIVSEHLNFDRIAVLAPMTEPGVAMVDAFLKELDSFEKQAVAIEWYSGMPENLSKQFHSLRKVAWDLREMEISYDDLLGMEIDSIESLFIISEEDFYEIETNTEKPMTKSDSLKVVLDEIDGIYMPIGSNDFSYIGAQFPAYNLQTTIIGNEYWQDYNVLNQRNIGPHLDGMVLVGSPIFTDYEEEIIYTSDYTKYLISVLAEDLIHYLIKVLDSKKHNRASIAKTLKEEDDFHGQANSFSFSSQGSSRNNILRIAQYNSSKFEHLGFFKNDSLIIDRSYLQR